jgi:anti-sigma regulatory factor (Ser/Thr protein kinase)
MIDDQKVVSTLTDSGIPFDPTQKGDVDTTLPAEERPIGGLGIHLVKQIMDKVSYQYVGNQNILTLEKNIK